MAIAYSDDGAYAVSGDITTASFSISCSGTDRILYVGLVTRKRTSDNSISSITYNGNAMTAAGNDSQVSFVDNKARFRDFYLLAPDTGGDHSVSITMSSNTDSLGMFGISFNGAAQEAPEAVSGGVEGTTATITDNLTTLTDGAMIVGGCMYYGTSGTTTPTTGQTETYDTGTATIVMSGAYENIATAGSEDMTWSYSGTATSHAIGVAALAPAEEAATTNKNLLILGAG